MRVCLGCKQKLSHKQAKYFRSWHSSTLNPTIDPTVEREQKPVIAILDYQPDKLYKYLEDTPLDRSLGYFQKGPTDVGRCTLNVDGTMPRTGVLDQIKRINQVKHQNSFFSASPTWIQSVSTCSHHHVFSTMMDCVLSNHGPKQTLLS